MRLVFQKSVATIEGNKIVEPDISYSDFPFNKNKKISVSINSSLIPEYEKKFAANVFKLYFLTRYRAYDYKDSDGKEQQGTICEL